MKKRIIDFYKSKDYNSSILFYSFFSAWLLSLPFQGQTLICLYSKHSKDLSNLSLIIIGVLILGQMTAGFLIHNIIKAKRTMKLITYIAIFGSTLFFLPYSSLWTIMILILSYLGGVYIATWGFYYRLFGSGEAKVIAIAKVLILSNVLMLLINIFSINISPYFGLGISILFLIVSLIIISITSVNLDEKDNAYITNNLDSLKPIVLLFVFILIFTITSGLMYSVINPAFSHLKILTSVYWVLPYVLAIYILMKSPKRVNKSYVLYFAITLIGLSFLLFSILDRSWISYIMINTLMMSGFGVCDLFWWSIIGELLNYVKNPAKLLGIGLAANILGILIGSTIGSKFVNWGNKLDPSILALIIIFIILMILPLLYKYLSLIIKDHMFLIHFYNKEETYKEEITNLVIKYPDLTDRENDIVDLLFTGRTYKMIAEELYLSENTIKTHIKNIYSKYEVQSKAGLIKKLENMK